MDGNRLKKSLESYFSTLKLIAKPKRLHDSILESTTLSLLASGIAHLVFSATLVLVIALTFSRKNTLDGVAILAARLAVVSIIFSPALFAVFALEKNKFSEKLKLSAFFPVFIVPLVLVPFLCAFAIFLKTEMYLFYYMGLLLLLAGNMTVVIGIPLCFNKKLFRVAGMLLSVTIFFALTSFIDLVSSKLNNSYSISHIDPIYAEFVKLEVYETSNAIYEHEYASEIIRKGNRFIETFDETYIMEISNIARSMKSKESAILRNSKHIVFNRNKKFYILSLNLISLAAEISAELENVRVIEEIDQVDVEGISIELTSLISRMNENKEKTESLNAEMKEMMDKVEAMQSKTDPEKWDKAFLEESIIRSREIIAEQEVIGADINVIQQQIENLSDRTDSVERLIDRIDFGATSMKEITDLFSRIIRSYEELIDLINQQNRIMEWKLKVGI